MIRVRTIVRFNRLGQIAAALPFRVGGQSKATADAIREDIQTSWSMGSPSSPGQPPAIVTGRLDESIEVERISPSIWSVKSDAPYAAFLEFGTRKMAPRPFFKPAAERQRDKHIQRVGEGVREAAGA